MTLTAEKLNEIYENPEQCSYSEIQEMAAMLVANREAQPVAWEMRYWNSGHNMWHDWERITAEQHAEISVLHAADNDYEFRVLYDAPPAPAVPDKPRLPPHIYRDLLDMLQEAAIAYGGTQQLRAQLSSALSIHVQPDHPHTRAAMLAQPVSGGYKLVPVEPTEAMLLVLGLTGSFESMEEKWQKMLAAAPEGGNDHDTRR